MHHRQDGQTTQSKYKTLYVNGIIGDMVSEFLTAEDLERLSERQMFGDIHITGDRYLTLLLQLAVGSALGDRFNKNNTV